MIEAETKMIHLQTKEHQGLLAVPGAKRKAWKRFSSRNFKKTTALPTP